MKTIILDPGHGIETPGKRSPIWADKTQLFEWKFNRDIVRGIANELRKLKIPFDFTTRSVGDMSLSRRCEVVNKLERRYPQGMILISIHANAGGGTGWEVWTTPGKTKSDEYATILFNEATKAFPEWKMRSDTTDGDPDKESKFAILMGVKCPAVLTENFFMDTEKDCKFIMSEEGKKRIIDMHVEAIKQMIE